MENKKDKLSTYIKKKERKESDIKNYDFDDIHITFSNFVNNLNLKDDDNDTEFFIIKTTNKNIYQNSPRTFFVKIEKEDILDIIYKNNIIENNIKYICKRTFLNNFYVNHKLYRII